MMDAKKQFSKIGLVLFLGTLLIYGVQTLAYAIADHVPAITQNGNLYFLTGMLPMYIIAYTLIFFMFKKVPTQIRGKKRKWVWTAGCIERKSSFHADVLETIERDFSQLQKREN